MAARSQQSYIQWFEDICYKDVARVGGKNASLGEMFRELGQEGITVPPGFAVTVEAYWRHIDANKLRSKIEELLISLSKRPDDLPKIAQDLRHLILEAPLPIDLVRSVTQAYDELSERCGELADVAVRSSATAEDLPTASFAGQQETFLHVQGQNALLETLRQCFASLFTDRAISYRTDKKFEHLKVGLSVGIQRMVRSDLAAAGVMFTLDTETGARDVVLINSSYGLGEAVVQGAVNPDEFYVFKPTLLQGKKAILHKRAGSKEFKLVYDTGAGRRTRIESVAVVDRERMSLSDEDILQLSQWACRIEKHYSDKLGVPTPMDIEWAKDGLTGRLFILQARPETVHSQRGALKIDVYSLDAAIREKAKVILRGRAVGDRIGVGLVRVIDDPRHLDQLQQGEVLVAQKTDPDWEPAMKRAAAIITDRGGRTCHAAIVSRELGIPAVVGCEYATSLLKIGQNVTVSCAEGDTGTIFDGLLPFTRQAVDASTLRPTFTNIMLNVANPDEALRLGLLPSDGVGLARMEFIISHAIKVHPMALVKYDDFPDCEEKREIDKITKGCLRRSDYFVDKLAEGVGMIAAGFYPREVIIRFSDFKTNEYAGLLGGKFFEPVEENPMLGFRGASRYYHERYRLGFALECAAIRRVRDDFGLTNVKVMIPFCRTVAEGRKVIAEMAQNGLKRGEAGLEIYVMCEIPSNIILADEFSEIFDGFSIGSNDLTQLILGVDRDSEIVASLFDERNKAVTSMIETVIEKAHAKGRKVGICGQAPSDYPEFASMLVRFGIDSISLSPDSYVRTARMIAQLEETGHDR
ncbi:MAG: phosphoenolpyruvate synthase [Proteobacteria bacterium]|nr:phosphoenolpyruvate synthase [Pseudomonadota bacterium]